jgi:hypothetical protein
MKTPVMLGSDAAIRLLDSSALIRSGLLSLMLSLGIISPAFASPFVTIGDIAGAAGTTVSVPISFDPGTDDIAAFSVTVTIEDSASFVSFTPLGLNDDGDYVACPSTLPPLASVITISCAVNVAAGTFTYVVDRAGNLPISAMQFGRIDFVTSASASPSDYGLTITTESYALAAGGAATAGTSIGGRITVNSATPAVPIPTLGQWSLTVMALALLLMAGLRFRSGRGRRQATLGIE